MMTEKSRNFQNIEQTTTTRRNTRNQQEIKKFIVVTF